MICNEVLLQCENAFEGALFSDYTNELNLEDNLLDEVRGGSAIICNKQKIYPAFLHRLKLRIVQRDESKRHFPCRRNDGSAQQWTKHVRRMVGRSDSEGGFFRARV